MGLQRGVAQECGSLADGWMDPRIGHNRLSNEIQAKGCELATKEGVL